jgi:hypothetical protein
VRGVGEFFQFPHLAAADQRGRLHLRTRLEDLARDDGASAARQLREFAKRFRGVGGSRPAPSFKSGEDGPFGRLLERNRFVLAPGLALTLCMLRRGAHRHRCGRGLMVPRGTARVL